jgi:hypothetical protein
VGDCHKDCYKAIGTNASRDRSHIHLEAVEGYLAHSQISRAT